MASEWRHCSLGDVVELKRGYDLPERDRRPGKTPIISSSGPSGYHNEAKVSGPGVVTGRYGTLGEVFYVANDFWPLNTTLYVRDFKGNDPRFISYFLRSLDFLAYSDKAAVPGLNRNHLHQARVSLPADVSEQRAIAHILGTLDDKIELNRRTSETLDEMTLALFRSWFVDFDPVRAEIEGRDSGLPRTLANLFPSGFVDSELGQIPDGWTVSAVYHVADVAYGAPFSSSLFNGQQEGLPLIRIRDLASELPSVWTVESHPKGHKVKPGDIVVGMDGEFRAYLWGGAEGWLNQRVCAFMPRPGWSAAFVRNAIAEPLARVEATETATTVIHLGKGDIDLFKVVVPARSIVNVFNRICQPWYDRMVLAKQQSRNLNSLRDALLPRLIHGDLRVCDAEKVVGSAK
jgi:type I restriction enzyme S subunit